MNLKQRYGKDSWVMVTGATDGIGKAFCEEFAKEGFNIILVSRNKEKLTFVSILIEEQYKVKTHVIEYDLTNMFKIEDYTKSFGNLADKFDIGILVNNVGMIDRGFMSEIKLESFVNTINVNILPQTYLTKILTTKMLKRSNKSAIIDLSSITSTGPMPYRAIYAATKSYNFFLSRALAEEFSNIYFYKKKRLFSGLNL